MIRPTNYYTSDLHFDHANVIKYDNRPFKDVEEMNELLIHNWNMTVGDDDTITVVGDFSLSKKAVEKYSHRLNGKRYLVPGNHDLCHGYHSMTRKAIKQAEPDRWQKFYEDHGWIVLPHVHDTGDAIVSHMPYDCTDPRYTEWVPKDEGKILIHGHTHQKEKIRGRMISVSVTSWDYSPVSAREIANLYIRSFEG